MLDSLFEQETTRVLDDAQARPRVPKPAEVNWWAGLATSVPRGVAAGGLKAGATGANVATAYGNVVGAFDPFGATVINRTDPEKVQKERTDALERIGRNEIAQSELADALRTAAREVRPDPETTGTAAQIVGGVADLVTQVAGGALVAGPVGAVAVPSTSEGAATYAELRAKGVDPETAAKVAAVRGVTTAVTIAAPVAGKTVAQTAGLVVAGGPGSYVVENFAAREILNRADYSQIAATFDPFDPVGLAVSTVAAGMFGAGAHALRARRGQQTPPPAGIPPQSEVVDAARVVLAREAEDAGRLAPRDDLAAVAREQQAMEQAEAQMIAGERVSVDPGTVPPREFVQQIDEAAAAARSEETVPQAVPKRVEAPVDPELAPVLTAARQITDAVAAGKTTVDEALAAPGTRPDVNNMTLALLEAGDRADELLRRIAAFRQADQANPLQNAIVDAADSLRIDPEGKAVPLPSPDAAPAKGDPATELVRTQPDMEVEIDVDGAPQRMSAADAMKVIEERARTEAQDAELLNVAATCMLED